MADNYFKDTFISNQDNNTDDNGSKTPIIVDGREYTAVFDDSVINPPTTSDIDVYHSRLKIRIEQ